MSTISDIYRSYKIALQDSRERYEKLYTERSQNSAIFYRDFFHRLIIPFKGIFADSHQRRLLKQKTVAFFSAGYTGFRGH